MPLTDIPNFSGGANIAPSNSGTPTLADILEEHKAAIEGGIVGTSLALTTTGNGAALIGIEDADALFAGTTVEAALAEKLTGLRAANVADDAVIGGIEVVHIVAIADGVTADKDVVFTHKTEITQIEVLKTGGAGGASDTLQVKSAANAITDAMDINVADKIIVRPSTIDDAYTVIAAAGTLRITKTKVSGANVACRVIIRGIRRA